MRCRGHSLRGRNDLGAVDELRGVLADNGELGHGRLECGLHLRLVGHKRLPSASSARVAGQLKEWQNIRVKFSEEMGSE